MQPLELARQQAKLFMELPDFKDIVESVFATPPPDWVALASRPGRVCHHSVGAHE
jgi:hypothetical protein